MRKIWEVAILSSNSQQEGKYIFQNVKLLLSHSRYTRAAFLTNIPVIARAHETPRSNYPCLKHLCGCFWNNVASKIFAQPVFWGVEIGSYFKHTATVWWSTPQSVSTGCSTLQNGSRWATSHTWLDIFPRRRTTRQIKSAPQFSTGANIKRDRGREREHASCSLPAHSCVFSMLCWGFESKYAKVREAWLLVRTEREINWISNKHADVRYG